MRRVARFVHTGRAARSVDDRLPAPLYHQIYLILRDKIAGGVHKTGDVLPGEEETARQYGVSRITAKRALNELADAGYVVRERGRGTRVVDTLPAPPMGANVEPLLDEFVATDQKSEATLLEFGYVAPGEAVAQALRCAGGERVQRAVRVRCLEGQPFCYLMTYVPEDVGRSFTREEVASTAPLTLMERCGVEVSRAEQTLTATRADAVVASKLGVDLGAPLLRITRIIYDQRNRPVEYIVGLYRPDRYQYRMALSRVHTDRPDGPNHGIG